MGVEKERDGGKSARNWLLGLRPSQGKRKLSSDPKKKKDSGKCAMMKTLYGGGVAPSLGLVTTGFIARNLIL